MNSDRILSIETSPLLPQVVNEEALLKAKPLRLLSINGAYLYARPNQILLAESSDHMVIIHLSAGDKMKKAIRHSLLSDIEKLLPTEIFCRVNRYCIVNTGRLSGVNLEENKLEFDMTHSVETKHSLPAVFFRRFGM